MRPRPSGSGVGQAREPNAHAQPVPSRDARFSAEDDFVFATSEGTPFYYRKVAVRGLDRARTRQVSTETGCRSSRSTDLRHTYGSHLVRQGLDVVRISRQLGHARPSITLNIYAHEFEQAQHADDVSAKLTAAFGGIL
jgi:integrase